MFSRLVALFILMAIALPVIAQDSAWVYVGTYTSKKGSKGIHKLELDLKAGKLTDRGAVAETPNPTFLAIHPNKTHLYAANEVGEFNGVKGGAVSAYSIDPKTGDLTYLNSQSTIGGGPCHLNVDKTGKFVLAANYGGGSTVVLPIGPDGKLAEKSAFVQHEGKSVLPRQSQPHAHSVNLDPANQFAFAADLGLDKILIFKFDQNKGTLTPNDPPHTALAPGAGPRHFAFHPQGKFAYVINEITQTVTAFQYDSGKGALSEIQTITSVPKETKGNSTAEVVVHPSGKFLYGSNRGHNSIAIYKIDESTGKLTVVGHQTHLISTPRNFVIDPTGQYLLAAGQGNGKVVLFRIDQATGNLNPTESVVEVPSPVCLRVLMK